jgi:hypothetical protein
MNVDRGGLTMISARLVTVGVFVCTLSPTSARAQVLSFSSMRPAEVCADKARRLAAMPPARLARKLRRLESTWFQFTGTEDEMEARFLLQNPCMRFSMDRAKCPQLQALVDETVGDTLGARVRLIIPEPTDTMRDKYAEMYARTFCPDLKGPPDHAVTNSRDEAIAVLVEAPPVADGFVPPEMVGLRAVMKALSAEIFRPRRKLKIAQARNKAVADTVVSVLTVENVGRQRTVRATVTVQGKSFDFDGAADDADFTTAAEALATKIVDWIEENQARIRQRRVPQP